jgi:hypothetical protein
MNCTERTWYLIVPSIEIMAVAVTSFFLVLFFYLQILHYVSGSAKGAVGLDSLTFDKVNISRYL